MSKPNKASSVLEQLGAGDPPEGLFKTALTHRSFAYEQPEPVEHNERLELLGDAVLGLVVADLVFQSYPDLAEGELAILRASVVNTSALADIARAIGLGDLILLGRGEVTTGGRDKASVLADSLEALVGAAYLERGLSAVANALRPLFEEAVADVVEAGEHLDAKGALQEVAVRDGGARPSYEVRSSGPDHDKRFDAQVSLAGVVRGEGRGRSKKEAEQNAAREALATLGKTASQLRSADTETADARAS